MIFYIFFKGINPPLKLETEVVTRFNSKYTSLLKYFSLLEAIKLTIPFNIEENQVNYYINYNNNNKVGFIKKNYGTYENFL